jgi:acyl-CoA synthetase (AMP-forming)/AMP-acid ligase II
MLFENSFAISRSHPARRATLGDQLRRNAQHHPTKAAVIFYRPDGSRELIDYRELNSRANKAAHAFSAMGVGHGDVVAMMSRNSPDFIAAYFGAIKLGAAFTGVNFTFTETEIAFQINHAGPKVLIVEDAFVERIVAMKTPLPSVTTFVVSDTIGDSAPQHWTRFSALMNGDDHSEPVTDVMEDDVAMLVYTSGTEAFPKGVMIPHRNYLISTTPAWASGLGILPSDVWLFLMPFHTIAGLGSMTSIVLLGATLVLAHTVDAKMATTIIAADRVTLMAQTPTFYLAMTQVDGFNTMDVGSLRRCITYGGLVPRSMIDAWRLAAPEVMWGTYWGQSELSQLGSIGWFATLEDIPGGDPSWIGKPVPQLEVRVVNDEGNDDDVGELWCRTPSAMLGYLNDPERTEAVFAEGWVHTGDLVRTDADGNLFFFDRKKDMIKTGGMNVSSVEVERVLYQHDSVLEAAVVGVPDDYWTEAVNAFVVARPGKTVDSVDLIAHCKGQLAAFKSPKVVHVVESLPKDTQGKILKRKLREQVSKG